MSQTHSKLLDEIKALHEKKAADYANDSNRYANFERAAELASWFSRPVDKVFATLIGVKLARLGELTQPGRVPNNESLDDSFVDLTNYAAIWTSYRRDQQEKPISPKEIEEGLGATPFPLPHGDDCRCYRCHVRRHPESHVFWPKVADGSCMICGCAVGDKEGRQKALCKPHTLEYTYEK